MTTGEKIKARREFLNMSQDELAKKCGYRSRSSIQKLETSRGIPADKISILANALEISEAYLMGWYDKGNKLGDAEEDGTLLLKFGLLSPSNRAIILSTIDTMLDIQNKTEKI